MLFGLRQFATHVALIAMILRAFLPAGWMPDARAAAPGLVICSLDGPSSPDQDHKKQDNGQHPVVCPFTALGHMAQVSDHGTVTASPRLASLADLPLRDRSSQKRHSYTPQGPRAPPTLL